MNRSEIRRFVKYDEYPADLWPQAILGMGHAAGLEPSGAEQEVWSPVRLGEFPVLHPSVHDHGPIAIPLGVRQNLLDSRVQQQRYGRGLPGPDPATKRDAANAGGGKRDEDDLICGTADARIWPLRGLRSRCGTEPCDEHEGRRRVRH